jgi:hypothetical protein
MLEGRVSLYSLLPNIFTDIHIITKRVAGVSITRRLVLESPARH